MAGPSEKIKALFRKYDKSGDGFIDPDELEGVLKCLGGFAKSEISVVFARIDTNHDGRVSTDEFVDWIMAGKTKADVRAKALLAPSEDNALGPTFYNFCGSGHGDMDSKSFTKLCKDLRLVDKKLSTTDVDLIFAKVVTKGQRRISLQQFEAALKLVAEKKGMRLEDIHEVVTDAAGPQISGTKAEAVRFHDDKSTYTGTHAHSGPSHVAQRGPAGAPHPPASPPPQQGHGRRPGPAAASASQSGQLKEQEGPLSLGELFEKWAGGAEMDGKTFAKLCKDCKLLDAKFTVNDIDILFCKVVVHGQRKIGFKQFEDATWLLAEKKGIDFSVAVDQMCSAGGPKIHGTVADSVRFHDDKSTYTGAHRHGGPEAGPVGSGTAVANASITRGP